MNFAIAGTSADRWNWVRGGPGLLYERNALSRPAFELHKLGERDLAQYTHRGTLTCFVRNRFLRNPGRVIRQHAGIPPSGSDDDETVGNGHDQPPPLGQRRTRWDLDAKALHLPVGSAGANGRQKVQVRVVLHTGLEFFPPAWGIPAITAKSAAAANRLVNLEVARTQNKNRAIATFWALKEANAAADVVDEYNIAVVAIDSADPNFALPLIIDPPIRNRG